MNFFTKHGKALLLLAAALAVCLSGCSGKKNPVNPSGGNIVCEDGEAWIMDDTDGGYIFRPDGDMILVAALGNDRWFGSKVGTYSIDGNKLTLVRNGEADTMTYKVSGEKLTLTGGENTIEFTKRTGVYVDV